MNRDEVLQRLTSSAEPWDLIIIGGGATGAGIAVDAAVRGYRTLLLEQSDFGKGTSSRSTKLAHGGVRYLQQGNVSLVLDALHERGLMRRNAPHLVHDQPFVLPCYRWWEAPYYGIGLKLYDLLSGRLSFGRSLLLGRKETVSRLPTIEQAGLRGGVLYHDGQFDDTRLIVNLLQTAAEHGAAMANYVRVTGLLKDADGKVNGVAAQDLESGASFEIRGRVVVNATGPFTDAVRRMDEPSARPMISPSQGIHIVLDRSFLPGDHALMVPRTDDGRVLFAIPWHGHVVVGTTDTPIREVSLEPRPLEEEVEFLLVHAARYLTKDPTADDVLSVFVGIRPLVKSSDTERTASLSRDHTLQSSPSGLITITGGKWTTYRKMAEDVVNQAARQGGLEERPCTTRDLPIRGSHPNAQEFGELAVYGSDAPALRALMQEKPEYAERLHPASPITAAQVVWAARHEMARTVEDVLARRTRQLLLGARVSVEMAPAVARLLAAELNRDGAWAEEQVKAYTELARQYMLPVAGGPDTPSEDAQGSLSGASAA